MFVNVGSTGIYVVVGFSCLKKEKQLNLYLFWFILLTALFLIYSLAFNY